MPDNTESSRRSRASVEPHERVTPESPDGPTPTRNDDGPRGTLDRLLESPGDLVARMLTETGDRRRTLRTILLVALLGFALYGAAMGTFQGGAQILRSMVKAPLVVLASLLLCLPSLYVFTGLAGGGTSIRRVTVTAAIYAALLAAVLVALMPISWLFSTVSRQLWFVALIHLFAWMLALLLALRVLGHATTRPRARSGAATALSLLVWSALLFVVSLQMATSLRPVLWQEPDAPFIEQEKKFFLEHFEEVCRMEPVA